VKDAHAKGEEAEGSDEVNQDVVHVVFGVGGELISKILKSHRV